MDPYAHGWPIIFQVTKVICELFHKMPAPLVVIKANKYYGAIKNGEVLALTKEGELAGLHGSKYKSFALTNKHSLRIKKILKVMLQ